MHDESQRSYAFIGYRERDERNEFIDFTSDKDEIINRIKCVKENGGDDSAEDIEHALQMFCDDITFAQGGTLLIIHIADAPCHGEIYHDPSISDNHPDWSNKIPKLLKKISDNFNCGYWFIKLNNSTDKMVREFNKILKRDCPASEFNEITEMDLRGLKDDIIRNYIQDGLLKASATMTKINMNK